MNTNTPKCVCSPSLKRAGRATVGNDAPRQNGAVMSLCAAPSLILSGAGDPAFLPQSQRRGSGMKALHSSVSRTAPTWPGRSASRSFRGVSDV